MYVIARGPGGEPFDDLGAAGSDFIGWGESLQEFRPGVAPGGDGFYQPVAPWLRVGRSKVIALLGKPVPRIRQRLGVVMQAADEAADWLIGAAAIILDQCLDCFGVWVAA